LSIESVLRDANKKYGMGTARIMTDSTIEDIRRVSTGSLAVDLALSGGIPTGRNIELFGPEMSGKSTLALYIVANFQREFPERWAVYIDYEHTLDRKLAQAYGVQLNKLILVQPDTAEEGLNILETLVRENEVSVVVQDSVSAMLPQSEDENPMEQQTIGLQARLLSKALRKLTHVAYKHDATLIWINQIREKVGVLYGNPETTSGGRALKFYSSVRMEVRQGEKLKEKDGIVGHIANVKVVKNKTAPPYKQASFTLIYGKGIDRVRETADIAIGLGLVKKGGAWLSILDDNMEVVIKNEVPLKFQGRDAFVEYLYTDNELLEELRNQIKGSAPTIDLEGIKEDE
jgi:recombination protein RecA